MGKITKKWLWMTPEELTALGELAKEKLHEQIKEADRDEQTYRESGKWREEKKKGKLEKLNNSGTSL